MSAHHRYNSRPGLDQCKGPAKTLSRHDSVVSRQPLQRSHHDDGSAIPPFTASVLNHFTTADQAWTFDSGQFTTSDMPPATCDDANAYAHVAGLHTSSPTIALASDFDLGLAASVQTPWDYDFDFAVAQQQGPASLAQILQSQQVTMPMSQPFADLDMLGLVQPLDTPDLLPTEPVMLPLEFDPASAAAEIAAHPPDLFLPASTTQFAMDQYLTMPGPLPLDLYPNSYNATYDCQFQTTAQLRDSPTNSAFEVCSISGSDAGWAAINMAALPNPALPVTCANGPDVYPRVTTDQNLHMRQTSASSCEEYTRRESQPSDPEDVSQTTYLLQYQQNPLPEAAMDTIAACQYQPMPTQPNAVCTPPGDDSSSPSSVFSVKHAAPDAIPQLLPKEWSNGVDTAPKRRKTASGCATAGKSATRISKSNINYDKTVIQAAAPVAAPSDRRIGRRSGPLRPDQREQARETRKVRACLRCKFLKKTCGRGNPCLSCQHSHARLWQVPCTRLDIKELHLFSGTFKCDYQKKVGDSKTARGEILGFGDQTYTLWITHGYDQLLPVSAREIFVKDQSMFFTSWIEANGGSADDEHDKKYSQFKIEKTPPLSVGVDGINIAILSQYLDNYIEGDFEAFIDQYMGSGTKYIPGLLKTAHRYYKSTRAAIIRRALRFWTAYALTCHVTFCEGLYDEEAANKARVGPDSNFAGKVLAPRLINFQVKYALSRVWREMHKEVLADLSSLYNSVYQGDKLRQWPHIFFVASILLAVWEMMQFDVNFREDEDEAGAVLKAKFCKDMEAVPVGVIVGLFQTISTKLPSIADWNSQHHAGVINHDPYMCDALTEISALVNEHGTSYGMMARVTVLTSSIEDYLRARHAAAFDENDIDCLANKLGAKLVIRVS